MNSELTHKLELLASNKQAIDKAFFLEFGVSQVISGLFFASMGREADIEKMKEAKKILSKKKSIFSAFRDVSELVVISKMALEKDPEQYLGDIIEVFDTLGKGKAIEDSYQVLASMIIVDHGRKNDVIELREKIQDIMRRMSKAHPLLTSSEDLPLTTLLAMTEKDTDQIINGMEECFSYIKKDLKIKADLNAIQALSQILVLNDGDIKTKCDKVAELFNCFKEQGSKFGTYLEFPALGTLVNVDVPSDRLVSEIIEAADYLKKNKGFSGLSMDKKTRLMFAAILVSGVYLKDSGDDTALNTAVATNNAIAMAVAEELAVMVIIMCSMSANSN